MRKRWVMLVAIVSLGVFLSGCEKMGASLGGLWKKEKSSGNSQVNKPVVQAAEPKQAVDGVTEKLKKLKALKDEGLLTDNEYNTKRKTLLNEIVPAPDNNEIPKAKEEKANTEDQSLKVAIFVVNRDKREYDDKLGTLEDLLTNRLADKGFYVINKDETAKAMQETKEDSDQVKSIKRQLQSHNVEMKKQEGNYLAGVTDDLDNASALRMCQMLGADYVLIATLTSTGSVSKETAAYGQKITSKETTMRVGVKVLSSTQGGTLYGDMVTVSEKKAGSITVEDSDLINRLMDEASIKLAENLSSKVGKIVSRTPKDLPDTSILVTCNVENADLLVDGAVIGSCGGKVDIKPGLHMIEVKREWFRPWKRNVNVKEGMKLDVQLELSEKGMAQYLALKKALQGLEIQKAWSDGLLKALGITSEAEAYMLKKMGDAAVEKAKHPDDITTIIKL